MKLKNVPIFHLSYSSSGGAGNIAKQLSSAQSDLGYESHLVTSSSANVSKHPLEHPAVSLAAILDKFLLVKPGSQLFSVLRGKLQTLSRDSYQAGSIIHLHWLPGAVSEFALSDLVDSGLKIVWTLHDYRPLTGGCHFTHGCKKFENGCNGCPQVSPWARPAIAKSHQRSMNRIKGRNITFVAPSRGLQLAAENSSISAGSRVEFIPNPIRDFAKFSEKPARKESNNLKNFLFVAANVKESRKGLAQVLSWWNLHRKLGQILTLIGANSESFSDSRHGITGLGVMSPEGVNRYMNDADVLLFGSTEDNAPGVIAEAVLAGLPIFALDPKMQQWLSHEGTPLLKLKQLHSLESIKAFCSEELPDQSKQFIESRDSALVASKYLELYFE